MIHTFDVSFIPLRGAPILARVRFDPERAPYARLEAPYFEDFVEEDAISRAITQIWGKDCYRFSTSQIVRPVPGASYRGGDVVCEIEEVTVTERTRKARAAG